MRPLPILVVLLFPALSYSEESVQEKLEQWYKASADQAKPQACTQERGNVEHNEKNVVFDMVNCGEEGTTKEFLFEKDAGGDFATDGRYKGMGVVSTWDYEKSEDEDTEKLGIRMAKLAEVQKDEDRQTQKCLKLKKVFAGTREIWRVAGKFLHGRPEGEVKVTFSNKERALMHFNKGVPHGRFRYFNSEDQLMAVGEYDNGEAIGPCWSFPEPSEGADGEFLHGVCDNRGYNTFKPNSVTVRGMISTSDVGAGLKVASSVIKGKFVADGVMDECMEVELVRFAASKHCVPFMFSKELDENAERFMQSLKFGIRMTKGDHYSKSYCFNYETQTEPNEWNEEGDVSEPIIKWTQNILAYTQMGEDPIWAISNDTSPSFDKKAPKFFSGLENIQKNTYEAVVNFLGQKEAFEFEYHGPTNKKGLFHGVGKVVVAKKQFCLRGECGIPKLDSLEGRFNKGKLVGRIRVQREGKVHYVGVKEDVQHGVTVSLGQKFATEDHPDMEDLLRPEGFSYIAAFENGKPSGKIWVSLPGGGLLHGLADKDKPDTVTDNEAAYLYQSMNMALVGEFKQNKMVSAKAGVVKKERCGRGVKEIEVEVTGETAFTYGPPTEDSLGDQPTVADPYEANFVEVNAEGNLVTAKDITNGQIVAFYSGRIAASRNSKNIGLKSLSMTKPVFFDKPEDGDYVATLGHKARFGTKELVANAVVAPVEHPRFGVVAGLVLMKELKAGEEIVLHESWREEQENVKDEL